MKTKKAVKTKKTVKTKALNPELQLGATGLFPDGKINEHDEGELRCAISTDEVNNQVVIEFGTQIAWLSFDPERAIDFANLIIDKARKMQN